MEIQLIIFSSEEDRDCCYFHRGKEGRMEGGSILYLGNNNRLIEHLNEDLFWNLCRQYVVEEQKKKKMFQEWIN